MGVTAMARGLTLTLAEEKFAQAYIDCDGNAELAWTKAFGDSRRERGWSNAGRMLKKAPVFLRIQELRANVIERLDMSRNELIDQLAPIARSCVTDYYSWDEDGNLALKTSDDLTREQAKAISEVIVTKEASGRSTIRFKLHDKIPAVKQIAALAGYSGETNINVTQFVLRAPTVEKTTEDWLAKNQGHALPDAKQIEASAVDITPTVEHAPPYSPPAHETERKAAPERPTLPEPKGLRMDGERGPRGGGYKRF
jgi:Terminase small subunit